MAKTETKAESERTQFGKHTPGPWVNDCFMVKSLAYGTAGTYRGTVICHTGSWDVRDGNEAENNARLIAQSPEMYDAIQLAIACLAGGFEVETADELAEKHPAAAGALRVLMPFIDDKTQEAIKRTK